MSAKSDRDNRSNQLNPNNAAYAASGSGNASRDDADAPLARRRRTEDELYAQLARELGELGRHSEPMHSTYTLAVVAFNGRIRHVQFRVKIPPAFSFNSVSPGTVILSVWDAYLDWVKQECPLGVAYARIWGPGMRSLPGPVWFAPKVSEQELKTAVPRLGLTADDLNRARAWYGEIRDIATKYEYACDWQDASGSEDLGEISIEIPYGAPSPYL